MSKYQPVRAIEFINECEVTQYKTVRASECVDPNFYIRTDGEVRITRESQLDRVENKMDKILKLLEGKKVRIE